MKFKLLFLILVIPFFGIGQKPNFKEIEKNLSNSKSNYNYERLIFKFKGMPKFLDSIEARYLYYGRNFRKDNVSTLSVDFKDLAGSFRKNDFEQCIKKGKILYMKDPTNLDVILILLRAYDQTKSVENFVHHLAQLKLLTDAIRTSGDGTSELTAFVVNSVGDEYIFLNMLNIGQDYSRSSTTYEDSVVDKWSKDNHQIYIKVLYMDF